MVAGARAPMSGVGRVAGVWYYPVSAVMADTVRWRPAGSARR
jgi:hypothetical protein